VVPPSVGVLASTPPTVQSFAQLFTAHWLTVVMHVLQSAVCFGEQMLLQL
jgi:hypothetical protein